MKLIENVDNKQIFDINDLYRFRFDSDEIADNMVRTWGQEVGDPFEVSTSLVQKAIEMYQSGIFEDEEGDQIIDVEKAMHKPAYQSYI